LQGGEGRISDAEISLKGKRLKEGERGKEGPESLRRAGTHCAALDAGAPTDNVPQIRDALSYLSAAIQAHHRQL